MDQDAIWCEGRPPPRSYCVRWGPSSPVKRGTAPNFRPMSIVAKRSPISATAEHLLHTYRLQAHHHRHRHIFSGNYMRTKSEVVNKKRVQWTGQQGSPVTDGTDKIKIYKRPSSDVKNHEIFSGWKIQWKFHDFFYTSNTAQGLKWDGMERYAIPALLNSAWNHTATSCLINTIPVWRMANAGHSANCRGSGVDLPATMTDPLLM